MMVDELSGQYSKDEVLIITLSFEREKKDTACTHTLESVFFLWLCTVVRMDIRSGRLDVWRLLNTTQHMNSVVGCRLCMPVPAPHVHTKNIRGGTMRPAMPRNTPPGVCAWHQNCHSSLLGPTSH